MLKLLNVKVSLGICSVCFVPRNSPTTSSYGIKTCWCIIMMGLMVICMACGNSPMKDENHEQIVEQPDLTDMVLIPAGEFLMGSPEGEGLSNERPQHRVYLDAYYIDKYEVTNAQFKEFVDATGYVTDAERRGLGYVWPIWPPGTAVLGVNWRFPKCPKNAMRAEENHPVVQVSWNDAKAYADWAGKRLPTEAEWEKAARGTDGRKWPWGNVFNLEIDGVTVHANIDGETVPVGQFPTGISPYGLYNMAGNVREWVADWYEPDYYSYSPWNNPKGPEFGKFRVLKGSSVADGVPQNSRSAVRRSQTQDYTSNFIGFRCAIDF